MNNTRGFTLTELAVVMFIVGLLLSTMMYTLSAQTEQRNREETQRRLELARELLLSYAVVNGRLPCPARSDNTTSPLTVAGDEVRNVAGECSGVHALGTAEDYYGGTILAGITGGLLPARAIGFEYVDAGGFAIDAWGNRIRYAIEKSVTSCAGTSTLPHFTHATNLKANGITCLPRDLLVCKSGTGVVGTAGSTSCGALSNFLVSANTVVAVVHSVGKNFAYAAVSTDEAANAVNNVVNDPVFVSRSPSPADSPSGEFDDMMVWIPVGVLYSRMIAAGVLP